jgi:hypothetical protein
MIISATKTRRSEEERIQALEAQITAIKARAAAKKIKRDPSLRHISAAVRSIDKALAASQDAATKGALGQARATIAACLSLNGELPKSDRGTLIPQRRRAVGPVEASALLAHIQAHPGQRGEEIAAALGTETKTMRAGHPPGLIDEKRVKTKGQAEGDDVPHGMSARTFTQQQLEFGGTGPAVHGAMEWRQHQPGKKRRCSPS